MKHYHPVLRKLMFVGAILCAGMQLSSCDDRTSKVYESSPLAPSLSKLKGDELYNILGSTIVDKGVNFAVYAKHATRVEVLIFDSKNPDTDQPTIRIPMTKDEESGIWTQFVYGIGVGTHYGYIAFGPNWEYDEKFYPGSSIGFKTDCDEEGNRYNPNKLLTDPYTRRISHDFDWGSGGNPASGTARDISDWKSAAKSVVIQSDYKWSENEKVWRENRMKGDAFEGHAKNDLIFYEVHPKGFTSKDLKIDNPGTWRGIGEKAEYLKELGITAVELMPVGEKPDDGTYWGYNTIAFFAPEQRFATTINQGKTNGVHDEFKEMVDKLHQAGIEVILDVVYNHTGEGGFWRSKVQDPTSSYGTQANFDDKTAATIYSFRGLDNKEYYHLQEDASSKVKNQKYLDETGVGNQMRANNKPFRRLIVDNLRFWVDEMHVDGFRFDLASILGVTEEQMSEEGYDMHSGDNVFWRDNVGGTVLQDIIDDDLMAKYHTRFIAEPWSLSQYANGLFPKSTKHPGHAWFEWNGRYRDMIRPFVNKNGFKLDRTETLSPYWSHDVNLGNVLTGSSVMFGDDGRQPYHSVNFLTAHDGMTLYDLVTYNKKNNKCSKLNDICCNSAYNAFCDTISGEDDNKSRNWCSNDCWEAGCNYNDDGTVKKRDDGYDDCWDEGCMDDGYDSMSICVDAGKEALKRQMIRNYFTLLFTTPGSPMMLGGDEYMRTQFGNNNAYSDSSDNEWNWFRWGDWIQVEANLRMHDFVRDIIKIRKQYKQFFSPSTYEEAGRVQWWWPEGTSSDNGWSTKSTQMVYDDGSGTIVSVLINMETYDKKLFYLPDGYQWKVLVDTQSYYDNQYLTETPNIDKKTTHNIWLDGSNLVSGTTYEVQPRSIVIVTNK